MTATNIEFQADSLFLDLSFRTLHFGVWIHEEYDGREYDLDEIEIELTSDTGIVTYLYLPADGLQKSDIEKPEFAHNFASFLDANVTFESDEFTYKYNHLTHFVTKFGTWEKKPKARFDVDEQLRLARILKNQRIIRELEKNLKEFNSKIPNFEKDQVISDRRVTPEDVLKVVRTGYINRAGDLFAMWRTTPTEPIETRTIKRLLIKGGPYRGLVSSGFHSWRLVKQKQAVPVNSTGRFYFIPTEDEVVLDECDSHELPLWKRIYWEACVFLYGEVEV